MGSPDLLVVCVSAFAAVFLLLTLLAVVMRALIAVFPDPGARIANIQEER
jgi:Na+-transporting methylmalonyl-CoA/oxaloacetate decarboxylase gamma subunit